jgi:predicted transcriptional regulator
MNAALLIHAIVRQTTVLIATLATSSGQRTQLASVANLVFADLARELREQGLGNKVIADMFGLALRTYHRKLARLSASHTIQGRSLWEAVLGHIQQHGPLLRSELLLRFARDDEDTLRAVVSDLVESGLVRLEGRDDAARLEAAEPVAGGAAAPGPGTIEAIVLVALHRAGPLDLEGLAALVPADLGELDKTLAGLTSGGLVTRHETAGQTQYSCERCVIPFGDEAGWEAAVFDHFQALVVAVVTKLRLGTRRADAADSIGGSTFVFDLCEGHPMQAEILGYLKTMREHGLRLRARLDQHNAAAPMSAQAVPLRVTAYVGQTVTELEGSDHA